MPLSAQELDGCRVTRFLIAEGRPSDVTQDQWVQENRSEALSWLGFLELLSKGECIQARQEETHMRSVYQQHDRCTRRLFCERFKKDCVPASQQALLMILNLFEQPSLR